MSEIRTETGTRRGKRPGWKKWLWILPGVLLILWGAVMLERVPDVGQYVFLPGAEDKAPAGSGTVRKSIPWLQKLTETEQEWGNAFPADSLHGTAEGVSLKTGVVTVDQVTVTETLGDYFGVYPRAFTAGRPLARGDAGQQVIVLDSALAYKMFGENEAVDQIVSIGTARFQVVGVAEARNYVGKRGSGQAWIPLGASGAPDCTIMTLSVGGTGLDNLRSIFENGAKGHFGTGQTILTRKEKIRGTVMLRVVLILLMLRILALWSRKLREWFGKWIRGLKEEMRYCYPRQMIWKFLGRGLQMLLLTAAGVAAAAVLVYWGSQMMTAFPEWVPENLVKPEAIAVRFRELTTEAANPLRFVTPELAEIRFWSGMIRWGIVLALTGWVIASLSGRRKAAENIDQKIEEVTK